jgi:putative peptidoglycan lipid II flippase
MALGTLASRGTGFLRVVAMSAAIGVSIPGGISDPYNVANTAPNIVYELLLGGVLTSIVVPLLVQAAREDDDEGEAFTSLFLSLVVVLLGAAAIVGVLAAPLIASVYGYGDGPERDVTIGFLRLLIPQIVFYGAGATISAILNTRRRFGAPMFAPVLNNVIVIATALVFITLDGPRPPTSAGLTTDQLLTLGIGTTLGIVVMTLALLPSLRASGFRWRFHLGRHPRLGHAARLGGWVLLYVAANQLAYALIVRLARQAVDGGYTAYNYAFILFQLPHAVVTVSVVTALVPRLSAHSLDDNPSAVRAEVSRGLRLVGSVVVPAALLYVVLSSPIARVVTQHGVTSADQARFTGQVLAAFALGLLSFSAFQLLLRVFYARQDSRTPALLNLAVNAVNVAADYTLFALLDGRSRVVGLALGHALAYTVGTVLLARRLRRDLGGLDGARVARTLVRVLLASLLGALGAWGAARIALGLLGDGWTAAVAALVAGGFAGVALYVSAAARMHVREVTSLQATAGRLLRRSR